MKELHRATPKKPSAHQGVWILFDPKTLHTPPYPFSVPGRIPCGGGGGTTGGPAPEKRLRLAMQRWRAADAEAKPVNAKSILRGPRFSAPCSLCRAQKPISLGLVYKKQGAMPVRPGIWLRRKVNRMSAFAKEVQNRLSRSLCVGERLPTSPLPLTVHQEVVVDLEVRHLAIKERPGPLPRRKGSTRRRACVPNGRGRSWQRSHS